MQYRLNLYFKNSQRGQIAYTVDFGCNMTVSLCGNIKYKVQQDQNGYYILYDPMKAGFKVNSQGYVNFQVSD